MENNLPQPTDDDDFTSFTPLGSTREFALARRWGKVTSHATLRQIFELLSKEPGREMYLIEIATALEKSKTWVRAEIRHFVWTNVVEVEKRPTRTYKSLASASNGACNLGTIIETSNQNLTGVPLTPNGSTIFKLGSDYYYLNGPQAVCSSDSTVNQLLTQQKTAFRNDFKTVQLDQ